MRFSFLFHLQYCTLSVMLMWLLQYNKEPIMTAAEGPECHLHLFAISKVSKNAPAKHSHCTQTGYRKMVYWDEIILNKRFFFSFYTPEGLCTKDHNEIFKVSTCISVVTMKETHFGTMVKNWKKKHSKDVLNIFINIVPETLFPHSIFHTLPVDGVIKPTNYFGTIAAEAGRLITAFIAKSAASSQSCERNEKQTMVF